MFIQSVCGDVSTKVGYELSQGVPPRQPFGGKFLALSVVQRFFRTLIFESVAIGRISRRCILLCRVEQRLHQEIAPVSPLGLCHVPQSCCGEHQCRMPVGKCSNDACASPDLTDNPLKRIVATTQWLQAKELPRAGPSGGTLSRPDILGLA